MVDAAIQSNQSFLSQPILKALNYHAIACLHTAAFLELGMFAPVSKD